jgi:ABC-type amino acid transport substrate-binding protein
MLGQMDCIEMNDQNFAQEHADTREHQGAARCVRTNVVKNVSNDARARHALPLQKTAILAKLCLLLLLSTTLLIAAPVQQQGAPTLVPPTLVPAAEQPMVDVLPSESGLARIQRDGKVLVGILFNEPPFGELSLRTDENGNLIVAGFDADLARAMAEAWGVTAEFVQVTRQTAVDMLANGQIDLLLAAQPHLRELDQRIEFSEAYYPSTQSMMVRPDDESAGLAQMADRRVGVVMGTRSEAAVNWWLDRVDYTATVQPYYTLDQALAALFAGEVDGVVENRTHLTRAVTEPGAARILEEPVMPEAYAVGLRRQDVNLRNLVDKTLQFLLQSGRLNEIHQTNFNGVDYPPSTLIPWANLGEEAPRPDQFTTDVPLPAQYVVPRLQSEHVVRIAGIVDLPSDASESARRLDAVHRLLVNAMAERWGVTVVLVPDSGQNPLDFVANGQADIAIGVTPDWTNAGTVDFTGYYLVHGLQLLVEVDRNINSVGDLRSKAVGVFNNEQGTVDILRSLAEEQNALIDDPYPIREEDAAFSMLAAEDINLDALFGDSMKLVAALEANPDELAVVTNADGRSHWYSQSYRVMAVPRNDIDFRLLVDYTLQELILDGTLQNMTTPVQRPQDIPRYDVWPGAFEYLGFNLRRAG